MVIKIPLNSTWKAKIGHFQVKEQFSELFWDSILFLKLSSPKTLVTVAPARQNNGRQRWRSEDERRIIGSVFVIWSQRADRHRRLTSRLTTKRLQLLSSTQGKKLRVGMLVAIRNAKCKLWRSRMEMSASVSLPPLQQRHTLQLHSPLCNQSRKSLQTALLIQRGLPVRICKIHKPLRRFNKPSKMKCPAQTNKMKAPLYRELPQNRRGKERWTQRYLLCAVETKQLSCIKISWDLEAVENV